MACLLVIAALPGIALAQSNGVTVDPGSPGETEYQLPLAAARESVGAKPHTEATSPSTTATSTPEPFGAGAVPDNTAAADDSGSGEPRRSGQSPVREEGRESQAPGKLREARREVVPDVDLRAASAGAGGLSSPLALMGGGGVVLLFGGAAGLVLRRRLQ